MKKDNKGFSLVELIVVVLIMGILAVALTPQVLRWVNNSRVANDFQLAANMETAAEVAMTNEKANKYGTTKGTFEITNNNGKAQCTDIATGTEGDTDTDGKFAFGNRFLKSLGESAITDVEFKSNVKKIVITITSSGKVTTAVYDKTGTSVLADPEAE